MESPSAEKRRTLKAISTLNNSGIYQDKGIRMSANSTHLQNGSYDKRSKNTGEQFPPILKNSSEYMLKMTGTSSK